LGRTIPLNSVMETVEIRIRALQGDLDLVKNDNANSISSTERLFESYKHDAESLCEDLVKLLQEVMTAIGDVTEHSIGSIVFVGRVAAELSSSPLFRSGIDCSSERLHAFKEDTRLIHDQTLDRWREHAVRDVVRNHWLSKGHRPHPRTKGRDQRRGPSPAILGALVTLSSSMQELGSSLDPARRRSWSLETLDTFIQAVLESVGDDTAGGWHGVQQTYWDLQLLLQICKSWDDAESNNVVLLRRRMEQLREQLSSEGTTEDELADNTASDHLTRMQMLFNTLLPPLPTLLPSSPDGKPANASNLLRFGVPSADSQFAHGIDVVKPALRLGLLLVGS